MRRLLAVFVLALSSCAAPPVAWVPQLVVRGQIAQDAAGAALDWRVEGGLRWDLSRARARREPVGRVRAAHAPASGCAHHATCAWERRERARALSGALELAGIEHRGGDR